MADPEAAWCVQRGGVCWTFLCGKYFLTGWRFISYSAIRIPNSASRPSTGLEDFRPLSARGHAQAGGGPCLYRRVLVTSQAHGVMPPAWLYVGKGLFSGRLKPLGRSRWSRQLWLGQIRSNHENKRINRLTLELRMIYYNPVCPGLLGRKRRRLERVTPINQEKEAVGRQPMRLNVSGVV